VRMELDPALDLVAASPLAGPNTAPPPEAPAQGRASAAPKRPRRPGKPGARGLAATPV